MKKAEFDKPNKPKRKSPSHKCEICKREFTSESYLKTHECINRRKKK